MLKWGMVGSMSNTQFYHFACDSCKTIFNSEAELRGHQTKRHHKGILRFKTQED